MKKVILIDAGLSVRPIRNEHTTNKDQILTNSHDLAHIQALSRTELAALALQVSLCYRLQTAWMQKRHSIRALDKIRASDKCLNSYDTQLINLALNSPVCFLLQT